jgi:hypothetical protein
VFLDMITFDDEIDLILKSINFQKKSKLILE